MGLQVCPIKCVATCIIPAQETSLYRRIFWTLKGSAYLVLPYSCVTTIAQGQISLGDTGGTYYEDLSIEWH